MHNFNLRIFLKGVIVMKRLLLKIVSAVTALTAALTFNIGSSAEKSSDGLSVNSETMTVTVEFQEYADAYNKAFDEAMDDMMPRLEKEMEEFNKLTSQGIAADDPHIAIRQEADKIAQAKCEELGLTRSADISLKLIATSPYKYWVGNFNVQGDIADTTVRLSTPDSFIFSASGRTAALTSKTGYYGNFKSTSVTLNYDQDVKSHGHSTSATYYCSATADAKSGTILKANYMFTMYAGDRVTTDIHEMVSINLTKA